MPRTLSTHSLLTYDEVCRACGVPTPGPTTGDKWESLLDVAERATDDLEQALGARLLVTRGAITEYHTPMPQIPAVLYLGQFPVISITTVKTGYWGSSGSWVAIETLTAGTDYVVDTERGTLTRVSSGAPAAWDSGFETVQVVYSGGYANTASVPQRIKRVAAALAGRMLSATSRGQTDAQTISDGMGSVTRFLPAELLAMERAALASERRYHTTGRAA